MEKNILSSPEHLNARVGGNRLSESTAQIVADALDHCQWSEQVLQAIWQQLLGKTPYELHPDRKDSIKTLSRLFWEDGTRWWEITETGKIFQHYDWYLYIPVRFKNGMYGVLGYHIDFLLRNDRWCVQEHSLSLFLSPSDYEEFKTETKAFKLIAKAKTMPTISVVAPGNPDNPSPEARYFASATGNVVVSVDNQRIVKAMNQGRNPIQIKTIK